MERGKCRHIFASLAGGLWMLLHCTAWSIAAEEAKPARVQNRQRLRLQRLHPRRLLAAAPAPKLPPYFTATSPDPKTTLWPDPTGSQFRCLGDACGRRQGGHPGKAVDSRRL